MNDYYGEEPSTPEIEFVKVDPAYAEHHLMDDMEIEDARDVQRMVRVMPKVRPPANPKVIKKKIVRVPYFEKGHHDVLKQRKLKPAVATPNSYLVKGTKNKIIPLPQELCIELIGRIKQEPCIWDSTSEHFRNKKNKDQAWNRVAAHLALPVELLKAKWTSILGSLRSYNSRYKKGMHTDSKPSWFAYELLSFMGNEIGSVQTKDSLERSSASHHGARYVPSSSRRVTDRPPSPTEVIEEYVEERSLPSNAAPTTINSTAEMDDPNDAPDSTCNEEILRIVRSMSKVLNKMANIGMSVDYGRYVNQHLKEYDDEIRRKTVKGIMDLITAADEEMSFKYPDRSKVTVQNSGANPHKK
ncbi:uncharacterized protein LOC118509727 [Anopheles stephensi]|uniref:uncharacterized protein LOC118509727 n=1 Tax=Anopheles stephensi TaxID=30069 RepID=UPI0016588BEC|nr:uncharacterized protein LOC118509727 [Anopheles stephensi]XP_035906731.1 uncharacterized protein LOC118509727 [Anopheles stephensi]XP_035906732.1 uncharacterized protein LOC118509727 [Anopheles stephensi]